MKRFIMVLLLAVAPFVRAANIPAATPSTTNNDDSCDIGVYPAATLLLPYFEVDFNAPATTARTTLFTIVNTTRVPQIANVTIWTDWAYPVLDFDVFLTGYDVQAINVYDILARGIVAPPTNTSNATTPGSRSLPNNSNPNFLPSAQASCASLGAGIIPSPFLADIRTALTTGSYSLCPNQAIGATHANAVGYVTIDVVATCDPKLPNDPTYFDALLFDNVLTGDYQHLNPNPVTGNYASGNPLVHIRAVPEGGASGQVVATGLPYTYYDRYTPAESRRIDRRQPLPSTFSARFIQGGRSAFDTDVQVWREGVTGSVTSCSDWSKNSDMRIVDVVRFDERENPMVFLPSSPLPVPPPGLPAASRVSSASSRFPTSNDGIGGWLYLNLNNLGSNAYSAASGRDFKTGTSTIIGPRQSQNWVSLTMYAEGRFSASMDATQLANGCTPAAAVDAPIGPGPNVTP